MSSDQQKVLNRLALLRDQIQPTLSNISPDFRIQVNQCSQENNNNNNSPSTGEQKVTITDHRTGKTLEIPIIKNTFNIAALSQLGLFTFDPGYTQTAVCESRITWIDGDKGELHYRGYPIEQLAENSNFLEVAFLLINGDLPNEIQFAEWESKILKHTAIHEDLKTMLKTFRYDAHPMSILMSGVSMQASFFAEQIPALKGGDVYDNVPLRNKQIYRLIGKMTTLAAYAFRHRIGRPYNTPRSDLTYAENFLYMLDAQDPSYRPNPKLAQALDVLFILHADHELNCSTATVRTISSANADVYTCISAGIGALFGRNHGGANESVLRMLEEIATVDRIPDFLQRVKDRKAKLMGFGHRVYKNYDPRAKVIRGIAYQVFSIVGKEPLIEVAIELEKAALNDPYFQTRKLYPNVDFYTGTIYKALGFPTDMFPVLFAVPRTVGWLAHWLEAIQDPQQKIVRPRQRYLGPDRRDFLPISERQAAAWPTREINMSAHHKRSARDVKVRLF